MRTSDGSLRLTARGDAQWAQLVAARRAGLDEYLAGYDPDDHPDLRRMLDDLARDVVSAIPAGAHLAATLIRSCLRLENLREPAGNSSAGCYALAACTYPRRSCYP